MTRRLPGRPVPDWTQSVVLHSYENALADPEPPRGDREPWPREPKPQLWWHKAAASALRKGGAKVSSAINRQHEERRLTNKGCSEIGAL